MALTISAEGAKQRKKVDEIRRVLAVF